MNEVRGNKKCIYMFFIYTSIIGITFCICVVLNQQSFSLPLTFECLCRLSCMYCCFVQQNMLDVERVQSFPRQIPSATERSRRAICFISTFINMFQISLIRSWDLTEMYCYHICSSHQILSPSNITFLRLHLHLILNLWRSVGDQIQKT